MIKKVLNLRQEIVYRDEANDRNYGRIVGAAAWPWGSESGFSVVLGEEFNVTLALKARKLWLLDEAAAMSIFELHRRMAERGALYACDFWVGDRGNEGAMRAFRQANKALAEPLNLHQAPLAGSPLMAFYQQIGELLQPERKILSLGQSQSAETLRQARAEDLSKPATDFPILAALGYGVTEMVFHQRARAAGDKANVKTHWNIYQKMHGGRR